MQRAYLHVASYIKQKNIKRLKWVIKNLKIPQTKRKGNSIMKNFKKYVSPEINLFVCDDVIMSSTVDPDDDGAYVPDKEW